MSGKKKVLVALLCVGILAAVAAALVWCMGNYIMVDFRFYPNEAQMLDLRGKEISVQHYKKVQRRLPDCQILWDVPIQDQQYALDTKALTVTGLTDEDVKAVAYLEELETVNAVGCTDYEQLLKLKSSYPQLQVNYTVEIGGRTYSQDTETITIASVTEEELALLPYLTELTMVNLEGDVDAGQAAKIQEACRGRNITFAVVIGGESWADTSTHLTVTGATEEELERIGFLKELKQLHIADPKAKADTLTGLQEAYPDIQITWEYEIFGLTFHSTDTEIDISGISVENLAEVEAAMAYFPAAQKLIMCDCGQGNEEMAAFRERKREEYKVVWSVQCGKLTVRTDDTTFMPVRESVYYFFDEDAYNLRYCEDLVCIDIGHMSIHDVSFVKYLPNLKYLILAHTQVKDITPLSSCKNLAFLELDWSCVSDYSPLLGCTSLEDLNLGNTYGDPAPVMQMTWLKHLWWVDRASKAAMLQEALPDTEMYFAGNITVGGGWRKLQNYYDMRDLLGMEYMSG